MISYIFSSKEELLEQAEKDGACSLGLEWAKEQDDLETILKTIRPGYRLWCLQTGYDQFAEYFDWGLFGGKYWASLLSRQPQFIDKCPLEKLDGDAWSYLLSNQPQLLGKCPLEKRPLEKLSGEAWVYILSKQPQFAEYCNWELLHKSHWIDLLHEQPQFKEEFEKLKSEEKI